MRRLRVPLVVALVPGARDRAELAPARAPAAGRLAARSCSLVLGARARARAARVAAARAVRRRAALRPAIAVASRALRSHHPWRAARRFSGRLPRLLRRPAAVRSGRSTSGHARAAVLAAASCSPLALGARRGVSPAARWRSACSSSAPAGPRRCSTDDHDLLRGAVDPRGCALPARGPAAERRCRARPRRRSLGAVLVAVALVAARRSRPSPRASSCTGRRGIRTPARRRPVGVGYVWDSNYDGFHVAAQDDDRAQGARRRRARSTGARRRSTSSPARAGSSTCSRTRRALRQPARPHAERPARAVRRARPGDLEARRSSRSPRSRTITSSRRASPSATSRSSAARTSSRAARARSPASSSAAQRYASWSYSPHPTPAQLAATGAGYGRGRAAVPRGASGASRRRRSGRPTARRPCAGSSPTYPDYKPLYRRRAAVAGNAQSPYAAALALESWLRRPAASRYTQQPPPGARRAARSTSSLRTKRGYCQHFAGAMALMLRYLGIPARVADGFTSGTYDTQSKTWTVTDHDAHAWVEVWFRGYGWLPFDPTPGRGSLSAAYSSRRRDFGAASAQRSSRACAGVAAQHRGAPPGRLLRRARTPASRSAAPTSGAAQSPAARAFGTSSAAAACKLLALVARARDRRSLALVKAARRHASLRGRRIRAARLRACRARARATSSPTSGSASRRARRPRSVGGAPAVGARGRREPLRRRARPPRASRPPAGCRARPRRARATSSRGSRARCAGGSGSAPRARPRLAAVARLHR